MGHPDHASSYFLADLTLGGGFHRHDHSVIVHDRCDIVHTCTIEVIRAQLTQGEGAGCVSRVRGSYAMMDTDAYQLDRDAVVSAGIKPCVQQA